MPSQTTENIDEKPFATNLGFVNLGNFLGGTHDTVAITGNRDVVALYRGRWDVDANSILITELLGTDDDERVEVLGNGETLESKFSLQWTHKHI